MNLEAYVWECAGGHEFVVSEETMRQAVVEPRCRCGARLRTKLRPFRPWPWPKPREWPASARTGPCRKCGSVDVYTRWHQSSGACVRAETRVYVSDEHMHHVCRGCGFEWSSPPLDKVSSS